VNTTASVEGGCLCGTIRYRIDGPIAPGAHCHCSMCRRSTGAVVVTWISVRRHAFHLLRGSLRLHRSSVAAERGFCGTCGAHITFSHRDTPDVVDVTVATLDEPGAHPPDRHIFSPDRISWLNLDAHLVAYPGDTPSTHGNAPPQSPPT
jgi:Uncharacterized conserved protein